MDANFVRNYLLMNGKYFPSKELSNLGYILEGSNLSEHVVNKRFFNPVLITIIFWIFWPFQLFDRLLLKDWFWGFLKLFLPLIVGYLLYANRGSSFEFLIGILDGTEIIKLVAAFLLVFWGIWTIVDGFTIYSRTKKANYRAVLKVVNSPTAILNAPISNPTKNEAIVSQNKSFQEWKKMHTSSTINDFYRQQKGMN